MTQLLKIDGVKTPEIKETKAQAYLNLMKDKEQQYNTLRSKVGNNQTILSGIQRDINEVRYEMMLTDEEGDKHKVYELRQKKRELQDQLENTEDLTYISLSDYATNLLDDEQLEQLDQEALTEYKEMISQMRSYISKLQQEYERSKRFIDGYLHQYPSESIYQRADSIKNKMKNVK